ASLPDHLQMRPHRGRYRPGTTASDSSSDPTVRLVLVDEPFGLWPLDAMDYHDWYLRVAGVDVYPSASGGAEFGDGHFGTERNWLTQCTLRVVTVGATIGD